MRGERRVSVSELPNHDVAHYATVVSFSLKLMFFFVFEILLGSPAVFDLLALHRKC